MHVTTFPELEPILQTSELRMLEAQHAGAPLMERAGEAAALVAAALVARRAPVVVLAGPGNNGGDAFVLARRLRERFFDVATVFRGRVERLPRDAAAAYAAFTAAGGTTLDAPPAGAVALAVDGLFGLGLSRAPAAEHAELIAWINGVDAPRLALDVPSGIDADTGGIVGCAVHATATATFLAWKPGLLTGDGLDHAGAVSMHDLGVPAALQATGFRLTWRALAARRPAVLRRTRASVHKGTFGTLGIVGGARGMVGAALLAGRGALACGAGKVVVGLLADDAPVVDTGAPELMLRPAADALPGSDALIVGPGLGSSASARELVARALQQAVPVVLDADGLNIVSEVPELRTALAARTSPTLITPHPAEAARLLSCSTRDVQINRLRSATRLAADLRAHVVLKGAGSVLAYPDERFDINASGNPALATAGSGDVLAGMVGALLAQRIEARDALRLAVCAHGAAADVLVARGVGPVGLRASELPAAVRDLLNARDPA
jgi:ADP-dependent NAD(P)H-hydrate dehydratase / NAD(P)H-hydrate epimerase